MFMCLKLKITFYKNPNFVRKSKINSSFSFGNLCEDILNLLYNLICLVCNIRTNLLWFYVH